MWTNRFALIVNSVFPHALSLHWILLEILLG